MGNPHGSLSVTNGAFVPARALWDFGSRRPSRSGVRESRRPIIITSAKVAIFKLNEVVWKRTFRNLQVSSRLSRLEASPGAKGRPRSALQCRRRRRASASHTHIIRTVRPRVHRHMHRGGRTWQRQQKQKLPAAYRERVRWTWRINGIGTWFTGFWGTQTKRPLVPSSTYKEEHGSKGKGFRVKGRRLLSFGSYWWSRDRFYRSVMAIASGNAWSGSNVRTVGVQTPVWKQGRFGRCCAPIWGFLRFHRRVAWVEKKFPFLSHFRFRFLSILER